MGVVVDMLFALSDELERSEDIRAVFEVLGTALPILMFLAPAGAFFEVFKKKSVGTLTPLAFTSLVGCCLCWLIVGLETMEAPMIRPNVVGVALGVIYCGIYFYSLRCELRSPALNKDAASPKKRSRSRSPSPKKKAAMAQSSRKAVLDTCMRDFLRQLFFFVGVISTASGALAIYGLGEWCPSVACALQMVMCGAPLESLGAAWKKKNSILLGPMAMCVAGFLCSVVWTVLGVVWMKLYSVVIPNLLVRVPTLHPSLTSRALIFSSTKGRVRGVVLKNAMSEPLTLGVFTNGAAIVMWAVLNVAPKQKTLKTA
ncbi:unnamed protein product [Amoebophrya sp. A25]|nr:unnamed protein product [Amoebophrya sp. A25]|eukprot:GSA25T00018980001.1